VKLVQFQRDGGSIQAYRWHSASILFRQDINHTFALADHILLFMKTAIEANGTVDSVHLELLKTLRKKGIIDQIIVADAQGVLLFSAGTRPLNGLNNISDREHFKNHKETDTGQVLIASPRIVQATGVSTIFLSRRLNDANGNFAGIVSIGLSQDYFSNEFRQMDIGPEKSIVLMRTDGDFLARIPLLKADEQPSYFKHHIVLSYVNQGMSSGVYESPGVENIPRLASFQVLPDYSALVMVAISKEIALSDVISRHRERLFGAQMFSFLIMSILSILSWLGGKQHKMGLALQASDSKYRAIFEAATDGIYLYNIKTRDIIDVNEKACILCGYSREEIISGISHLFRGEEFPYSESDARRWLMRAVHGEPQLFEWKNKHRNGHYIWAEVSLKCTSIAKDDYIVGIVRDITERKSMEDEITKHRDDLQTIVEE